MRVRSLKISPRMETLALRAEGFEKREVVGDELLARADQEELIAKPGDLLFRCQAEDLAVQLVSERGLYCC